MDLQDRSTTDHYFPSAPFAASSFSAASASPPPYSLSQPINLRRSFAEPQIVTLNNVNGAQLRETLESRVRETGCKFVQEANDGSTLAAQYVPFTVAPRGGGKTFSNTIYYRTQVGDRVFTPQRIEMAKDHEKFHALESQTAPDSWASRYNMASLYCLSPTNKLIYIVASEVNAYGHEGLMTTLNVMKDPERSALLQLFESAKAQNDGAQSLALKKEYPDVAAASEFMEVCSKTPNLSDAVREYGMVVLSRLKANFVKGVPDMTLFDHYCSDALNDFETENLFGSYTPRYEFTRLSPDAKNIGNGIGLDIFGKDFEGFKAEIIACVSPENRARLEKIKHSFGLTDENALPTTREAVAASGQTWEQYVERSKNYVHVPPKPANSEPDLAAA